MNFVGFVAHGLSAVSVCAEIVGVRLLALTCGLIAVAIVGLANVVGVKLFTESAIPRLGHLHRQRAGGYPDAGHDVLAESFAS